MNGRQLANKRQLRTFLSFWRVGEAENDLRWFVRAAVCATLLSKNIIIGFLQVII